MLEKSRLSVQLSCYDYEMLDYTTKSATSMIATVGLESFGLQV